MTESEKAPVKVTNLIIGAGPCGLYLGKKLLSQDKDCLIVEKSRGVGGRVATRRIENEFADHGAPYLKSCRQLLDLYHELKIPGLKIDVKGLFNDDGMTTLFKKMAASLPVEKEIKITKLERKKDRWFAMAETNEIFEAESVILTSPLPQSIELLEKSQIDYRNKSDLKSVQYSKALIGLFITQEDIVLKEKLPEGVHSILPMKERSPRGKVSVLRLSEHLSALNFDKPDADNLRALENFFISSCEEVGKITYSELKKWRYAIPKSSLTAPFVEAAEKLYLAGDAFLYPDIRGALLSAEELSKKLI